MFLEKLQGASLNWLSATMRNIPHLSLKIIDGTLTIPYTMHDSKCPVCAIDWE